MKSAKLPITMSPPIRVYQYRAYPLSVTANYPETLAWFHSNFIHLKCNLNFGEMQDLNIDFIAGNIYGGIPWLEYVDCDFNRGGEADEHEICGKIISSIDEGYYYYTFVDEFYIPNRVAYQRFNNNHDLFIFGYDLVRSRFHIAGFDEKMNYVESDIGFDDFVCASKNCNIHSSNLIRMKQNQDYSFDKNKVIAKFEDYLHARNCAGRLSDYDFNHETEHMDHLNQHLMTEDWGFGMDIYEQISLYCGMLPQKRVKLDIRPFHCLWEHKKCMLERLKYFHENRLINDSGLIDTCQEIMVQADNIRLSVLKYTLTNNEDILTRINVKIHEIHSKELGLLPKIIHQLKTS
ncbi:hypothetical protein V3851_03900 [Paenibacillus sp. M1]|uniref:Butirosin biosynthesis protein H N-terminal domain-containing protein n=1 Tax=Paenibacillus haidiansis TaxID=1574488 RepID=A0ABU7VPZ5_9BACL